MSATTVSLQQAFFVWQTKSSCQPEGPQHHGKSQDCSECKVRINYMSSSHTRLSRCCSGHFSMTEGSIILRACWDVLQLAQLLEAISLMIHIMEPLETALGRTSRLLLLRRTRIP